MSPGDLHTLDSYINENRSFAVYRIPGEETCRLLVQDTGDTLLFNDIKELNGQSGFVMAPFQITGSCPIVVVKPSRIEEIRLHNNLFDWNGIQPDYKKDFPDNPGLKKDYNHRFHTFIAPVKEKRFKKLVLSRSITVGKEKDFSPAQAFLLACQRYIRSYVYLCHSPQAGTWLGSTPEMLLSGEGNVWNTVAIAGTQPLVDGELPKSWDDKNLIEQMLVSYYIRTQLQSFDIHPVEKGPYTVRAAELAHLRSDFHFALPQTLQLGNVLELLHPTPAVCGLPKEEAYRFISENEGYNRRYYSGFVGWLDPEGRNDLYVNLRCMNILSDSFTLFAGGGLLPSSVLEQEWNETEDKLKTMLFLTNARNYVFK